MVCLVLILFGSASAYAATVDYYVDPAGTDDDGYGTGTGTDAYATIGYAVTNVANPASDTIIINISGDTYTLSNQITVNRDFTNLTLQGAGVTSTIVQANAAENTADDIRVFMIYNGDTVAINDMTIRHGNGSLAGSAIRVDGDLTLNDCLITKNRSTGNFGGAIDAHTEDITVTINNCTISDNTTTNTLWSGAALSVYQATINITNSTITGNTSASQGALYGHGTVIWNITNSTIANNTSGSGYYAVNPVQGIMNIKNSIIANNSGDKDYKQAGTLNDNGYNIIEFPDDRGDWDGTSTMTWDGVDERWELNEDGDTVTGSLSLSATLADNDTTNGTQTLAISAGSIAIDAGSNVANNGIDIPTSDQRGQARTDDGDEVNVQSTVDIGAYERLANTTPVANAGPDQTDKEEGSVVTLDGSGSSDADEDELTYAWSQTVGTSVSLSSSTAESPTFTVPDIDADETLTFSLTVNDGTVDSSANTVNISIISIPVAAAGSNETDHADGTQISLSGTCTESDSSDTVYGWWAQVGVPECTLSGHVAASKTSGTTSVATTATCTPDDVAANTTLTFQLNCDDEDASVKTSQKTVAINAGPSATAQAVSTAEDTAKAITLAGEDSSDEIDSYAIVTEPSNGTLSGTEPNLTYTPSSNYNGSDSFTFTVNDGVQDSSAATVTISVSSSNDAPVIADEANQTLVCAANQNCELPSWSISDADGDDVTTSWSETSGSTLQFTNDGEIDLENYDPPKGTYYIHLIANDGTASTTSETVTISIPNNSPAITDEVDQAVECSSGENCGLPSWAATDADNDDMSYAWSQVSGPSILQFTDEGEVDLESSNPKRGTYEVKYDVSDGTTTTSSETVTITIPNNEPVIADVESDISITNAELEDSKYVLSEFTKDLDVDAIFTDFDNDTLAYSWSLDITNPDQAGFISTTSGSSELRVRIAGDITITTSVDDGNGGTSTEDIILSIPVPDVSESVMNLALSSWSFIDANTLNITGTLKSPVKKPSRLCIDIEPQSEMKGPL